MIPILYYNNTPLSEMNTNGIGRLSDCVSCVVTEERNGIYELEFVYPITGTHYNQLTIGRIISAIPSEGKTRQPFIVYRRSAEINGLVTFNCYHYSYLLSYLLMPNKYYSGGIQDVFTGFEDDPLTIGYGVPAFNFTTDKTTSGGYLCPGISSIKSLLFGNEGSILDVYGSGEYEYDKNNVYLYQNRGSDNGVTIRYGKNLVDINDVIDGSNLYSRVIPFWTDSETGTTVNGSIINVIGDDYFWKDENGDPITDENVVEITFEDVNGRVAPLDLSDAFENEPTAAQLNANAASWLRTNQPWIPKRNITVDFIPLAQTEEYKDFAQLETVKLCDTVHIIYEELGVVATAKVIKTEWNVLTDRYDKIEIGQATSDYKGYNGRLNIGGKTYKIVNGIITATIGA